MENKNRYYGDMNMRKNFLIGDCQTGTACGDLRLFTERGYILEKTLEKILDK
jgi:hypothetical protein